MGRQEQIDKIAQWMGWHQDYGENDIWRFPATKGQSHGSQAADSCFDPFTNPSDCARVMDEVVKRGMGYRVIYDPMAETSKWLAGLPRKSYGYSNNSESEAKMNALLEAIGKE